jgi:hypothetical protein
MLTTIKQEGKLIHNTSISLNGSVKELLGPGVDSKGL